MNTRIQYLLALMTALIVTPGLPAADGKPAPREEKRPLRALTPPARESRPLAPRESMKREKPEMEMVAFLGVETGPVSATISAQLGLPRGTGLVVQHVVPKSAADGVLNEHDILLRFDDQILIESRQLSVLIRTHKQGDEVTITYLRAGQKATAKVKLGEAEVPKVAAGFGGDPFPFGVGPLEKRFEFARPPGGSGEERAEVDRVLSMIRRAPAGDPVRIQIDRNRGPGFRAMALHTANSNMVFSDNEGSLELTTKDGAKTLVAKNADDEVLFSGPVTTPDERKALPGDVRVRLEKLEGMHDMTFQTDREFGGAESKVLRPRGIFFPRFDSVPVRGPGPIFY